MKSSRAAAENAIFFVEQPRVVELPRALRRRMADKHKTASPVEPEEFVVCTAPWGEYESFPTAQKAKKFLRRHSREIAEKFNY